MKNKDYLMMDPPSGWMYGFPKPVPVSVIGCEQSLTDWLMINGYPHDSIELALKHSRYWDCEDELLDGLEQNICDYVENIDG